MGTLANREAERIERLPDEEGIETFSTAPLKFKF